jgi:hypothetical protein
VGGYLVPAGDPVALGSAVGLALRLDRQSVRAGARRRLSLGPVIEAYEQALLEVAG